MIMPQKNPFELFSINQPGQPKVKPRITIDPEAGDRRKQIEIIKEEKEFQLENSEVWGE